MIDFFNAIEKHQSEHKRKLEDAGPTELRKSKVIKGVKEQDVLTKLDEQTVSKHHQLYLSLLSCSGKINSGGLPLMVMVGQAAGAAEARLSGQVTKGT